MSPPQTHLHPRHTSTPDTPPPQTISSSTLNIGHLWHSNTKIPSQPYTDNLRYKNFEWWMSTYESKLGLSSNLYYWPRRLECATQGGVAMRSWPLLLPFFALLSFFLFRLLLLTHFGDTPQGQNLSFVWKREVYTILNVMEVKLFCDKQHVDHDLGYVWSRTGDCF